MGQRDTCWRPMKGTGGQGPNPAPPADKPGHLSRAPASPPGRGPAPACRVSALVRNAAPPGTVACCETWPSASLAACLALRHEEGHGTLPA